MLGRLEEPSRSMAMSLALRDFVSGFLDQDVQFTHQLREVVRAVVRIGAGPPDTLHEMGDGRRVGRALAAVFGDEGE